jgi:hypothetical protein
MFDQDNMINHKEGSGGISARGNYTIGREIEDPIENAIRRTAEACESLDGIMVYFSPLGGTGSGLGTLISGKLSVNYPKKIKMGINLVPSQNLCDSTVAPYNFMLCKDAYIEYLDSSIMLSNQNINDLLYITNQHLNSLTFKETNQAIADFLLTLTAGLRQQKHSLTHIQQSLIIYPRLHFFTPANYIPSQSSIGDSSSLYSVQALLEDYKGRYAYRYLDFKEKKGDNKEVILG